MSLKHHQKRWSEALLSETKFSDAVAILGPDGQRRPFLRALLAVLSEPLAAALYGDFREAQGEITLKDVTPEAFEAMMRCAVGLDPEFSPLRAIYTLKAAKIYLMDGLSEHAMDYLMKESSYPGSALQVLHALEISGSQGLPEVTRQCYETLVAKTTETVKAESFLELHGKILAELLDKEKFQVDEELLWCRLMEWSKRAVVSPELLGPFEKRARHEEDLERGQRSAVLQQLARQMCFPLMSKTFFIDQVRPFLSREHSDAVMDHFLLNRALPEKFTPKRQRPVVAVEPESDSASTFSADVDVEEIETRATRRLARAPRVRPARTEARRR